MNNNITELVMYCSVRNEKQKEAERIQCIKSDKHIDGDLAVTIEMVI